MSLHVIFDDTLAVPAALKALVGVERFGALVFQRRTRVDAMRAAAEEAGAHFIHLVTAEDRAALHERIREVGDADESYLYCPSPLVAAVDQGALVTFLKQIEFAPVAMRVPLNGAGDRRGWTLMRSWLLPAFLAKLMENDLTGFFERHGEVFVDVSERISLIDVSEERVLLGFLSGQFDARHFNAITYDEYTVTKRSADRAKLKREYEFYRLVPPAMQMFLVQPFDFKDDGVSASYRMERLALPDMALQWVHGAFQPREFERFLAHIFHFLSVRPARATPREAAEAAQRALYVDKVASRIAQLKSLPEYAQLAPLLDRACGGIDALVARYLRLYDKLRKRFDHTRLVIGHGDPCFSNILYSKSNQYLKLIDPRGAESEADLYTDAYYDVAKLSHSIQGNYDFINLDKFDIAVDEKLRPRLTIDGPVQPWASAMFAERLVKAGFDPELTRLCEASLFISMMPLHIDRPRKVLGFAINASNILDALEGKDSAR